MRTEWICILCCWFAAACSATKPRRDFDDGILAVAYSGYRQGQHPDRGQGARNPSREQVLEDLRILVDRGFTLIRLYDSGENSRMTLELIREQQLPIRVMLGIWLRAEISNHAGCPWLTKPIPERELQLNRERNDREVATGIALAREFDQEVVAINVGNEMLVGWSDHLVPLDRVLGFVATIRASVDVQLTVAENYDWWRQHGQVLAEALDFVGVHTYPIWEGRDIDQGLDYTIENIEAVRTALPGKRVAILEAGWATTASEFGARAGEAAQARYFGELRDWCRREGITAFWFEAFDEPWKGDPGNPQGAEKHWGLFRVDRTPKQVMARRKADGTR